jgi:hypothetical protein
VPVIADLSSWLPEVAGKAGHCLGASGRCARGGQARIAFSAIFSKTQDFMAIALRSQ